MNHTERKKGHKSMDLFRRRIKRVIALFLSVLMLIPAGCGAADTQRGEQGDAFDAFNSMNLASSERRKTDTQKEEPTETSSTEEQEIKTEQMDTEATTEVPVQVEPYEISVEVIPEYEKAASMLKFFWDCSYDDSAIVSALEEAQERPFLLSILYGDFFKEYPEYDYSHGESRAAGASDPRGYSEKDGMGNWFRFSSKQIRWVLKNIFHMSEAEAEQQIKTLTESPEHEYGGVFYEEDGSLYYCQIAGYDESNPAVDIMKVLYDGVYYTFYCSGMEEDMQMGDTFAEYRVVMRPEEVDGITYWTVYRIEDLVKSGNGGWKYSLMHSLRYDSQFSCYRQYAILYLDDDDIPELIGVPEGRSDPGELLGWNPETEKWEGTYVSDDVVFAERTGLMSYSHSITGMMWEYDEHFERYRAGTVESIGHGHLAGDGEEATEITWDGQTCTKDEYDARYQMLRTQMGSGTVSIDDLQKYSADEVFKWLRQQ